MISRKTLLKLEIYRRGNIYTLYKQYCRKIDPFTPAPRRGDGAERRRPDVLFLGKEIVARQRIHFSNTKLNDRSLLNFPMQANGAEMMRLAACMATEAGLRVCAPIHDALLMEAPLERLEEEIFHLRAIMVKASEMVTVSRKRGAPASSQDAGELT